MSANLDHAAIVLATAYIEKNLSEKISLSDLTNVTQYSERSLQLFFKKRFNLTPLEYIDEKRLTRARTIIMTKHSNKKITELAYEVGYRHLGRFSINFRKKILSIVLLPILHLMVNQ
jgi:transcriptional regulator GlxA family with amidase domain